MFLIAKWKTSGLSDSAWLISWVIGMAIKTCSLCLILKLLFVYILLPWNIEVHGKTGIYIQPLYSFIFYPYSRIIMYIHLNEYEVRFFYYNSYFITTQFF